MRLCFLGTSHAAVTLAEAARRKGFEIGTIENSALIFISQDTPTDENGVRNLYEIQILCNFAKMQDFAPIILTSQVPPGFTRKQFRPNMYHQAETLRIEDAMQRAMHPEMLIVGCTSMDWPIDAMYLRYLEAFDAPILRMTYEDAEFTKMAINATLISQVENANRLAAAAAKCGADWQRVSRALRHDSRIGKYSYLTPGDPLASKHLLRDHVTLQGMV